MGALNLMSCFGLPSKKKQKGGSGEYVDPNLKLGLGQSAVTTSYTFKELKSGTNNFHSECKLEYGELGVLYKAVLSANEIVAVKRATRESHQTHADFQKEVKFLSGLHDKHLLNLRGFCEEKGEQILVYEFVANGNLADRFRGESGLSLTWRERVHVAICAAKGLAYLHKECQPPMIHGDVKPTNILLDHNLHAKIANFGPNASTHMLTGAMGMPSYVNPSNIKSNVGPACDIHSFGVVLLQLVTGKPACNCLQKEVSYHITDWVRLKLEAAELDEILDMNLRSATNNINHEILLHMARLGLQCTDLDTTSRPSMSQVVQELELGLQVVVVDEKKPHYYLNPSPPPPPPPPPPTTTVMSCDDVSYNDGSGYTCKSSGSDFSLPELGGKDAHIKFDGMEWIDIKSLEVPDFSDGVHDDDDDDGLVASLDPLEPLEPLESPESLEYLEPLESLESLESVEPVESVDHVDHVV